MSTKMLHCLHGPDICDSCWKQEQYNQNNVIIAQLQRQLDLLERLAGFDNLPLCINFPGPPVANTAYSLPAFEMGALVEWIIASTDATAAILQIYLQHSSIVLPNQRVLLAVFQGTGTFQVPPGKISVPRNGIIQAIFTATSGGTFFNMSASYARSEETGIEYFRTQRAGRLQ